MRVELSKDETLSQCLISTAVHRKLTYVPRPFEQPHVEEVARVPVSSKQSMFPDTPPEA